MNFEDVIRKRTATRKFSNKKVGKELIDKILEAGALAPTAKNKQPQKVYVVTKESDLKKIDEVSPCRYNAPVVLIVCADKNEACMLEDDSTYVMDATIVGVHMMLEATNLGVDNIWIKYFDPLKVKEKFNLEENVVPVFLLPLGYKADDYEGNIMHNKRKPVNETSVYL